MVKISVVVAVYQAENYIRRCVNSLLSQTFKDFEILFIDDGSFDKSGEICDEYASFDNRVKVIHKKNGGVSSARQVGLDCAKGEYVIHVDPDDWVEPTMLYELYECAKKNNSDIVACDFFVETRKKQIYVSQEPSGLSHQIYFYDLISKLHGACWNKLVKKDCFEKYNVSFPGNMTMCEDSYVNLMLTLNPVKISYLPRAFYHYNQHVNECSAVHLYNREKLESQKYLIDWLQTVVENQSVLLERKKQAKYTAMNLTTVSTEEFRELYSEINSFFKLDFKSIGRMDMFVFIALHISLSLARFLYYVKIKLTNILS